MTFSIAIHGFTMYLCTSLPVDFMIFSNASSLLNCVRLCCIGLVGLHHLFYKGAAGSLGLPPPLYAASPGAGPLGLQGRQPIRVSGVLPPPGAASTGGASPGRRPPGRRP
jgi:hypothetical protein